MFILKQAKTAEKSFLGILRDQKYRGKIPTTQRFMT